MGAAILCFWPSTTRKIPVNFATAIFYKKPALQLLRSGHRVYEKRENLSAFLTITKEAAICTANPSISGTSQLT